MAKGFGKYSKDKTDTIWIQCFEYRMIFLFPELKESENNAMLRKYIVEALKNHENGRIKEAAHCHIPVSNTYGMLVSDLGEWTVK
jgi:hypothetical protein